MLKKIILLVLTITLTNGIFSQGYNKIEHIKGKVYVKQNGKWKVKVDSNKYYNIIDDILAVKFNQGSSNSKIKNLENKNNLQLKRKSPTGWYFYKVNSDSIINNYKNILSSKIVQNAEVHRYGRFDLVPNDNLYAGFYQWYYNTNPDPNINIEGAWDLETGDPSVVVAVIDAGVVLNHEDLGKGSDSYENIYKNPGEDSWNDPLDPTTGNGQDDDGNTYVDDWKGWDFYNDVNDPTPKYGGISNSHGTSVAGIIGAKTNNNKGIAGVAGGWNNKGVQIMPLNVAKENPYAPGVVPVTEAVEEAIIYAVNNGADIINLSISLGESAAIKAAIDSAVNNGVIVISSSGNYDPDDPNNDDPSVEFPATYNNVISVNGTNKQDKRIYNGSHGKYLDLSAPGDNIYTLNDALPDEYCAKSSATSWATPIVSGVAALMKSANPCLGHMQTKDILNATADKVGGYNYNYINHVWFPGKSKQLGYGKINAHDAVQKAINAHSNSLDLYIKDRYDDLGIQPVVNGWDFDNSPDIWIRNEHYDNDDGDTLYHEQPTFSDGVSYVYVRVRNKSCAPSTSNMKLKLNWTVASTNNGWPHNWDGSNNKGGFIGEKTLVDPIIEPGGGDVYMFEFQKPSQITPNTNFCLLARIEGDDDPIDDQNPDKLAPWIRDENNIALSNLTMATTPRVWNDFEVPPGAAFLIGRNEEDISEFDIFFGRDQENNENMLEESEINIFVKNEFWDIVDNSPDVDFNGIEEIDENQLRITDVDASIERLKFEPEQRTEIYTGFNFYSERAEDADTTFFYSVKQRESEERIWTGNIHFKILKGARDEFDADGGGGINTFSGTSANLSGKKINEPATYNWYNMNDSILSKSKSLSIIPKNSKEFVYEVTAESDGFKDYDTVFVKVNPYKIKSLSPNPASSSLNVEYIADKANSAKLIIQMTSDPKVNYVYSINPKLSHFTVNVSNFQTAPYNVKLICDGKKVDSKQLIIQ